MSESIIIGIDPGITGALSKFGCGRLLDVKDMPVIVEKRPSKGASIRDIIGGSKDHTHKEVDKEALAALLREWSAGHSVKIVREKVGVRPNQGIVSSSRFLEVVGMLDGMAAAFGIPVETVEPELWKRMTSTPTSKKESCMHASKLFPDWAHMFRRTSIDHNRAEACLIGLYGVRYT